MLLRLVGFFAELATPFGQLRSLVELCGSNWTPTHRKVGSWRPVRLRTACLLRVGFIQPQRQERQSRLSVGVYTVTIGMVRGDLLLY